MYVGLICVTSAPPPPVNKPRTAEDGEVSLDGNSAGDGQSAARFAAPEGAGAPAPADADATSAPALKRRGGTAAVTRTPSTKQGAAPADGATASAIATRTFTAEWGGAPARRLAGAPDTSGFGGAACARGSAAEVAADAAAAVEAPIASPPLPPQLHPVSDTGISGVAVGVAKPDPARAVAEGGYV